MQEHTPSETEDAVPRIELGGETAGEVLAEMAVDAVEVPTETVVDAVVANADTAGTVEPGDDAVATAAPSVASVAEPPADGADPPPSPNVVAHDVPAPDVDSAEVELNMRPSSTRTPRGLARPTSRTVSPRPPPPRTRMAAELEQVYDVAQGELAPVREGETLVEFRRGCDNSHVNRMVAGSYSRYLLSTDHLHEAVLVESFYGTLPTIGTAPLNTLRDTPEPRSTQTSLDNRSAPHSRGHGQPPSYTPPLTPRQGSNTLTGTMSSTMRREAELLNAETHRQLCLQREHRRHDPRHGKSQSRSRDFVYYNHRSKGYHVPRDAASDALVLRYDDLYDFGDGTRFASRPPGAARRNPHAPPPVTHGEWARRTLPPPPHAHGTSPQRRVSGRSRESAAAHRMREAMQQGCSSLRTAKAIDPQRLHCSQFRKTRTIEDVVTERNAYPIAGARGVPIVMHADRQPKSTTPSRLGRCVAETRGDGGAPMAALTFTDRADKGVMGLLSGSVGYGACA